MDLSKCIELFALCLAVAIGFTHSSRCQWRISTLDNMFVYQLGETLDINCTYIGTDINATISKATILDPSGNPIPFRHDTGSRTLMVSRKLDKCSQGGTYVCMPDQCNRTLLNTKQIRVEDGARKPKLQCVFSRSYAAYSNISCSWYPNCINNYYNWFLLFKNGSGIEYHLCERTSDTSCIIPHAESLMYEKYQLKLVQGYLERNRTYEYTVYTNESMWRLEITFDEAKATSPSQLDITVHVSDSIRAMECVVHYASEWDNVTHQAKYNETYTQDLKQRLVLVRLEPYTQYAVSVKCKPVHSPYWSEPTAIHYARTMAQAPNEIPGTILFADEIDTADRRHIYLYWTPLPRRKLHGNETVYTATYKDARGRHVTDIYAASIVTAILTSTFPAKSGIIIRIGSRNEAGISSMNKTVYIPRSHKDMIVPVVTHRPDSSNVTVFWDTNFGHSGQWSFTYYWCRGTNAIGHLPQCHLPMHSKRSSNGTEIVHTGPRGNMNWYFGVSVEVANVSLQKIVWSDCAFTNTIKDTITPLTFSIVRHNATTIGLILDRGYCGFDNKPIVYQVAVLKDHVNCSDVHAYTNFTAVPSLTQLHVQLTGDQNAFICTRVLFDNGQHAVSEGIHVDAIIHSTPRLNPTAIGVIVGAAILVMMLGTIVASVFVYRKCKRRLQDVTKIEDVEIIAEPYTDTSDHTGRGDHAYSNVTDDINTAYTDIHISAYTFDNADNVTNVTPHVSSEIRREEHHETLHISMSKQLCLNTPGLNNESVDDIDNEFSVGRMKDIGVVRGRYLQEIENINLDSNMAGPSNGDVASYVERTFTDDNNSIQNNSLHVDAQLNLRVNASDKALHSGGASDIPDSAIDSYVKTTAVLPDPNSTSYQHSGQSVNSYVFGEHTHGVNLTMMHQGSILSSDSAISSSSRFSVDTYVTGIVP